MEAWLRGKRPLPTSSSTTTSTATSSVHKKARSSSASFAVPVAAHRRPTRLVSWNIEGMLKGQGGYSAALAGAGRAEAAAGFAVLDRADPIDVIALQEVWMHPAHPSGKLGHRLGGDTLRSTKTKRRAAVSRTLRTPPFDQFKAHWSLNATKNTAGTGVLVRKGVVVHSARFTLAALRAWAESNGAAAPPSPQVHHPEGRVLCLELDDFLLLNTYVPMGGTTDASRARRVAWDTEMAATLGACRAATLRSNVFKPVVWLGDLNTCAQDCDMSHPGPDGFFKGAKNSFYSTIGRKATRPRDVNLIGQPGTAPYEQLGMQASLDAGGLIDAHRVFHPARVVATEGGAASSSASRSGASSSSSSSAAASASYLTGGFDPDASLYRPDTEEVSNNCDVEEWEKDDVRVDNRGVALPVGPSIAAMSATPVLASGAGSGSSLSALLASAAEREAETEAAEERELKPWQRAALPPRAKAKATLNLMTHGGASTTAPLAPKPMSARSGGGPWTWVGMPPIKGGSTWTPMAGKGMRIDYFMVPREWCAGAGAGADSSSIRVIESTIVGRGLDRDKASCFFGSDHCPISLKIAYS